jgi:hypothetical protein
MGITLQNLYAETTDEQWNPAFVKTYSQLIYKVWCSAVQCSVGRLHHRIALKRLLYA